MNLKPAHPRLLVSDSTWADLRARREKEPTLDRFLKKLEETARVSLSLPVLTRQMTGKRLLLVSRTALERIVYWSLVYRVTGDEIFRDRAEREMLAIASFADWNPSHFLDVGEMTAAMALGYDWLYDVLSEESRRAIRAAIVEKGLRAGEDPAVPHNHWHRVRNNWNQVCLGGLVLGALAVGEDEPELAQRIIDNGKAYNRYGLEVYAPAGIYPEGPGYWSFGTTYQVLLLAGLESALGTDLGLGASSGFMQTGAYPIEVMGPTGIAYSYADNRELLGLESALFWFARKTGQPEILFYQHQMLERYLADTRPAAPIEGEHRMLPFLALWADDLEHRVVPERPPGWYVKSENPVVTYRSSWADPSGLYLAAKGGAAKLSHAHMDAGSFVLDVEGERWAHDLGMQEYESLESRKIDLWNFAQDGQRWEVFRLNNYSHNTLTINGQLHRVEGHAEVIRFSGGEKDAHAVLDLTPVFKGQAGKVVRGFRVLPGRAVLVRDEVSGLKSGDVVRWQMVTSAQVTVQGTRAVLSKNGKQLQVRLVAEPDGYLNVRPAAPEVPTDYDVVNTGRSILFADFRANVSGRIVIEVTLQPGEKGLPDADLGAVPCEGWSAALPA